MNILLHSASVAAGLAAGNFAYQLSQAAPNWDAAFEHSFFQLWAIMVLAAVIHFHSNASKP